MHLADLIKLLEKENHTQISIEPIHAAFAECEDLKLPPELYLHHSAFCRNRKLSDNNQSCAKNKKRSLQIAAKGHSFCGKCPFGIRELAQPIMLENELAAVCYFTMTDATVPLPELRRKAQWLAEYIRIVIASFSSERKARGKQHDPEYYRRKILYFLDLHYMENIGESDLAEYLGMNTKYCSALFLKIIRKRFRTFLTERRLYEATIYLKLHTNLNITTIALLCGFSDSNYFCSVFHRYYGLTPKEYRRSNTGIKKNSSSLKKAGKKLYYIRANFKINFQQKDR